MNHVMNRFRSNIVSIGIALCVAALMPVSAGFAQHIEDGRLVFPERRIKAAVAIPQLADWLVEKLSR